MECLSFNLKSSPPTPGPSPSSSSFPTSLQTQTQSIDLNSCPPLSQGNSTDGTPRSSTTQPSPTFNLRREYTLAVHTNSYQEIRSRIQEQLQVENVVESGDTDTHQLPLSQVLHPDRDCVNQALLNTNPNATLTRLVSNYFDRSENITNLCLVLYQCVSRARTLYSPIAALLQVFPYDLSTINHSQCDWAFDVFFKFDSLDNPFRCPDSHNLNDMRRSFSQLQEQLDHRLHKSLSRARFVHRATTGSAICLIGTVVGVAVSAVIISTHALAAIVGLVATPLCPIYVPSRLKKKQLAHMATLDAAAMGTYVHNKDLDTIVCLVTWSTMKQLSLEIPCLVRHTKKGNIQNRRRWFRWHREGRRGDCVCWRLVFFQLGIGEKADAKIIKAGMIGEGEMVIFLGSHLVNLVGVRVLWVSFGEFSKRIVQRRKRFMVGELGVWENRGSGF